MVEPRVADALRRGVPVTTPAVRPVDAVSSALDRGVERRVPIFVQGPAGVGKTTGVAAWLAGRPDLDAVWVTVTTTARQALRQAVELQLGMPASDADEDAAVWWARLAHHVREGGRRLVIVLDGVDRLLERRPLEDMLLVHEQLPDLTTVYVSRRPLVAAETAPLSRLQLVEAEFAWDSATARAAVDAAGITAPPVVVENIRMHADGRAEAVLDCARLWSQERETLPAERRRRPQRLVAEWIVDRARTAFGDRAAGLLLLLASLADVPGDLVSRLGEVLPETGSHDLELLLDHGFAVRRYSPLLRDSVYAVQSSAASELRLLALEREPELCREAHRIAAGLASTEGLAPYHRARAGEEREVAAFVLDHWRDRRSRGGAMYATALLALDDDVVAADPVLAALRVATDCMMPRTRAVATPAYAEMLLTLGADDLRVLDLPDRLLVEGAIVDTQLDRGQPGAAVKRSAALAEQQASRILELEPRARRALSYLLVVVAEAHLALLQPHRATYLAETVLDLEAGDRWTATAYRASAVLALCYGLNGERGPMREKILAAEAYAGFALIEPGPVRGVQWLAEFCDALHCGDAEATAALATKFAAFGRGSVTGGMTAATLEAASLIVRGEVEAASGELARLVTSPRFRLQSPAARALALLLAAQANLLAGRPGTVLDLVGPLSSPETHALCFESYKAAAHLALGRPSLALEATHECGQRSLQHSSFARAQVAAVRAAAHLELRRRDAARTEFLVALHLSPPEWRASALHLLPRSALAELRDLVAAELDADTLAALAAIVGTPGGGRDFATALSRKEVRLLELLCTDQSLSEIARQLFVSINTVKSQTRSLYRKLGVSSRIEAADLAYSMGSAVFAPDDGESVLRRRA